MLGSWLKDKLRRTPSKDRPSILIGGLDTDGQSALLNALSRDRSEWNLCGQGTTLLQADFYYKKAKKLPLEFALVHRGWTGTVEGTSLSKVSAIVIIVEPTNLTEARQLLDAVAALTKSMTSVIPILIFAQSPDPASISLEWVEKNLALSDAPWHLLQAFSGEKHSKVLRPTVLRAACASSGSGIHEGMLELLRFMHGKDLKESEASPLAWQITPAATIAAPQQTKPAPARKQNSFPSAGKDNSSRAASSTVEALITPRRTPSNPNPSVAPGGKIDGAVTSRSLNSDGGTARTPSSSAAASLPTLKRSPPVQDAHAETAAPRPPLPRGAPASAPALERESNSHVKPQAHAEGSEFEVPLDAPRGDRPHALGLPRPLTLKTGHSGPAAQLDLGLEGAKRARARGDADGSAPTKAVVRGNESGQREVGSEQSAPEGRPGTVPVPRRPQAAGAQTMAQTDFRSDNASESERTGPRTIPVGHQGSLQLTYTSHRPELPKHHAAVIEDEEPWTFQEGRDLDPDVNELEAREQERLRESAAQSASPSAGPGSGGKDKKVSSHVQYWNNQAEADPANASRIAPRPGEASAVVEAPSRTDALVAPVHHAQTAELGVDSERTLRQAGATADGTHHYDSAGPALESEPSSEHAVRVRETAAGSCLSAAARRRLIGRWYANNLSKHRLRVAASARASPATSSTVTPRQGPPTHWQGGPGGHHGVSGSAARSPVGSATPTPRSTGQVQGQVGVTPRSNSDAPPSSILNVTPRIGGVGASASGGATVPLAEHVPASGSDVDPGTGDEVARAAAAGHDPTADASSRMVGDSVSGGGMPTTTTLPAPTSTSARTPDPPRSDGALGLASGIRLRAEVCAAPEDSEPDSESMQRHDDGPESGVASGSPSGSFTSGVDEIAPATLSASMLDTISVMQQAIADANAASVRRVVEHHREYAEAADHDDDDDKARHHQQDEDEESEEDEDEENGQDRDGSASGHGHGGAASPGSFTFRSGPDSDSEPCIDDHDRDAGSGSSNQLKHGADSGVANSQHRRERENVNSQPDLARETRNVNYQYERTSSAQDASGALVMLPLRGPRSQQRDTHVPEPEAALVRGPSSSGFSQTVPPTALTRTSPTQPPPHPHPRIPPLTIPVHHHDDGALDSHSVARDHDHDGEVSPGPRSFQRHQLEPSPPNHTTSSHPLLATNQVSAAASNSSFRVDVSIGSLSPTGRSLSPLSRTSAEFSAPGFPHRGRDHDGRGAQQRHGADQRQKDAVCGIDSDSNRVRAFLPLQASAEATLVKRGRRASLVADTRVGAELQAGLGPKCDRETGMAPRSQESLASGQTVTQDRDAGLHGQSSGGSLRRSHHSSPSQQSSSSCGVAAVEEALSGSGPADCASLSLGYHQHQRQQVRAQDHHHPFSLESRIVGVDAGDAQWNGHAAVAQALLQQHRIQHKQVWDAETGASDPATHVGWHASGSSPSLEELKLFMPSPATNLLNLAKPNPARKADVGKGMLEPARPESEDPDHPRHQHQHDCEVESELKRKMWSANPLGQRHALYELLATIFPQRSGELSKLQQLDGQMDAVVLRYQA